MGVRLPGVVVGPKPQVLIRKVGIHNLAGVHLPLRVPEGLELPEGIDQLVAVHLPQEDRFRLAVSVFSGEGSAIR